MSDLEIRSGGAIAVDTELLRAVAARLREFGIRLGEFADRARWVATDAAATATRFGIDLEARWLASGADRAAEQPAALAAALDGLAAAYELIELRAQHAAAAATGDADAARAIESRMALLEQEYPDAARAADTAVRGWRSGGPIEMARQAAAATWWIPGMALPLALRRRMPRPRRPRHQCPGIAAGPGTRPRHLQPRRPEPLPRRLPCAQ